MTVYAFTAVAGTTLAGFDPAHDSLTFASVDAASVKVVQSGADVVIDVPYLAQSVTLAGVALSQLGGRPFVFEDGTRWRQGSSGDDAFVGTRGGDAFDLRAGGADTVSAGAGNDVIDFGSTLDATDVIDAGAGDSDVLRLAGDYAQTLLLSGSTISGVEGFALGSGGTIRLRLSGDFLSTATPTSWVRFDGQEQTATDALYLDGRQASKPLMADAGAGDDTVLGSAHDDWLSGGAGSDHLAGFGGDDVLSTDGSGNSTLLGGAGDDFLDTYSDTGTSTSRLVMAGGSGSDIVIGGGGNDRLYAAGWQNSVGDMVSDLASSRNRLDGQGGNDLLQGDAGHDDLLGGPGDDTLRGGEGGDSLDGGAGDDTLNGGGGNDILDGGTGQDVLAGGAGDDEYEIHDSAQRIVEAAGGGFDTVLVYATDYTLPADVENARLQANWGTSGGHRLVGNAQDNVLEGSYGDDTLEGGAGDDTLSGGSGHQRLVGGSGDDVYHASDGDLLVEAADGGVDTVVVWGSRFVLPAHIENGIVDESSYVGELVGNAGDNRLTSSGSSFLLRGLGGNDTLTGGASDTLVGGNGDDLYIGGSTVRERAGEGTDTWISSDEVTRLAVNVENLTLADEAREGVGNDLDNVIRGTSADNVLYGEAGADTLIGGGGDDEYHADKDDDVVETAEGGRDRIVAIGDFVLGANVEDLELLSFHDVGLHGKGNALDNTLTSSSQGNDTLDGGAGADTMDGGLGKDSYVVDNPGDVVVGDGSDVVRASINYTLPDGIRTLVLIGAATQGTGNQYDNELRGNDASNTLDGGEGADRMIGGGGDDTYIVDSLYDQVLETSADGGVDTVLSSETFTLSDHVENLTLTGTETVDGTGNGQANLLVGNAAANRLDGGAGADTLRGGRGDDVYDVDGGDVVVEAAGGGTDTIVTAGSYRLGARLENLTLVGGLDIDGKGNTLANVLVGNDGANRLDGGDGADSIDGGAGADTLVGGGGADTLEGGLDDDRVNGGDGADVMEGDYGDDTLIGGAGADTMHGGYGKDVYYVDDPGDVVVDPGGTGDTVFASVDYAMSQGGQILVLVGDALQATGDAGGNGIAGNAHDNLLDGGSGDDTIVGADGNDTLVGGKGADDLLGGAGHDRFVFRSTAESNFSDYDVLIDFTRGVDRIDLSQFDADTVSSGRQPLKFIGEQSEGKAGELWYETIQGGLVLFANTDDDARAEFVLVLAGVNALDRADFLL